MFSSDKFLVLSQTHKLPNLSRPHLLEDDLILGQLLEHATLLHHIQALPQTQGAVAVPELELQRRRGHGTGLWPAPPQVTREQTLTLTPLLDLLLLRRVSVLLVQER